jgi:hypothetical protein
VIGDLEYDLVFAAKDLGCTSNDFEHYLVAEQEHLASLQKPDPVVETKKAYVKALRDLVKYQYDSTLIYYP